MRFILLASTYLLMPCAWAKYLPASCSQDENVMVCYNTQSKDMRNLYIALELEVLVDFLLLKSDKSMCTCSVYKLLRKLRYIDVTVMSTSHCELEQMKKCGVKISLNDAQVTAGLVVSRENPRFRWAVKHHVTEMWDKMEDIRSAETRRAFYKGVLQDVSEEIYKLEDEALKTGTLLFVHDDTSDHTRGVLDMATQSVGAEELSGIRKPSSTSSLSAYNIWNNLRNLKTLDSDILTSNSKPTPKLKIRPQFKSWRKKRFSELTPNSKPTPKVKIRPQFKSWRKRTFSELTSNSKPTPKVKIRRQFKSWHNRKFNERTVNITQQVVWRGKKIARKRTRKSGNFLKLPGRGLLRRDSTSSVKTFTKHLGLHGVRKERSIDMARKFETRSALKIARKRHKRARTQAKQYPRPLPYKVYAGGEFLSLFDTNGIKEAAARETTVPPPAEMARDDNPFAFLRDAPAVTTLSPAAKRVKSMASKLGIALGSSAFLNSLVSGDQRTKGQDELKSLDDLGLTKPTELPFEITTKKTASVAPINDWQKLHREADHRIKSFVVFFIAVVGIITVIAVLFIVAMKSKPHRQLAGSDDGHPGLGRFVTDIKPKDSRQGKRVAFSEPNEAENLLDEHEAMIHKKRPVYEIYKGHSPNPDPHFETIQSYMPNMVLSTLGGRHVLTDFDIKRVEPEKKRKRNRNRNQHNSMCWQYDYSSDVDSDRGDVMSSKWDDPERRDRPTLVSFLDSIVHQEDGIMRQDHRDQFDIKRFSRRRSLKQRLLQATTNRGTRQHRPTESIHATRHKKQRNVITHASIQHNHRPHTSTDNNDNFNSDIAISNTNNNSSTQVTSKYVKEMQNQAYVQSRAELSPASENTGMKVVGFIYDGVNYAPTGGKMRLMDGHDYCNYRQPHETKPERVWRCKNGRTYLSEKTAQSGNKPSLETYSIENVRDCNHNYPMSKAESNSPPMHQYRDTHGYEERSGSRQQTRNVDAATTMNSYMQVESTGNSRRRRSTRNSSSKRDPEDRRLRERNSNSVDDFRERRSGHSFKRDENSMSSNDKSTQPRNTAVQKSKEVRTKSRSAHRDRDIQSSSPAQETAENQYRHSKFLQQEVDGTTFYSQYRDEALLDNYSVSRHILQIDDLLPYSPNHNTSQRGIGSSHREMIEPTSSECSSSECQSDTGTEHPRQRCREPSGHTIDFSENRMQDGPGTSQSSGEPTAENRWSRVSRTFTTDVLKKQDRPTPGDAAAEEREKWQRFSRIWAAEGPKKPDRPDSGDDAAAEKERWTQFSRTLAGPADGQGKTPEDMDKAVVVGVTSNDYDFVDNVKIRRKMPYDKFITMSVILEDTVSHQKMNLGHLMGRSIETEPEGMTVLKPISVENSYVLKYISDYQDETKGNNMATRREGKPGSPHKISHLHLPMPFRIVPGTVNHLKPIPAFPPEGKKGPFPDEGITWPVKFASLRPIVTQDSYKSPVGIMPKTKTKMTPHLREETYIMGGDTVEMPQWVSPFYKTFGSKSAKEVEQALEARDRKRSPSPGLRNTECRLKRFFNWLFGRDKCKEVQKRSSVHKRIPSRHMVARPKEKSEENLSETGDGEEDEEADSKAEPAKSNPDVTRSEEGLPTPSDQLESSDPLTPVEPVKPKEQTESSEPQTPSGSDGDSVMSVPQEHSTLPAASGPDANAPPPGELAPSEQPPTQGTSAPGEETASQQASASGEESTPPVLVYPGEESTPPAWAYPGEQSTPSPLIYPGEQSTPPAQVYPGEEPTPPALVYPVEESTPLAPVYPAEESTPAALVYPGDESTIPAWA